MSEENGQLELRALRALSAESLRKHRISSLRHELQELETELDVTAKATQDIIEHFAKAQCLALTTQVLTKLPREIRDMIYQHLSTRHHERIEREHSRATLDPLTKLYTYNHARWKAAHFPEYYWDSDYVGEAFFQELIENYYRSSTFIFNDDPSVLTRFLTTNEFTIPFLPKHLVSNVEIHLNAVSYDRGSFRAYMYGVPKAPERLHEQLEPVFELKHGARICVHFLSEAKGEGQREDYLRAGLETLFSKGQRDRLSGYKVRFVMDEVHVFDLGEELKRESAGVHG